MQKEYGFAKQQETYNEDFFKIEKRQNLNQVDNFITDMTKIRTCSFCGIEFKLRHSLGSLRCNRKQFELHDHVDIQSESNNNHNIYNLPNWLLAFAKHYNYEFANNLDYTSPDLADKNHLVQIIRHKSTPLFK